MTFEAGSGLLTASAVTARLIDRGRHFHLVAASSSVTSPISSTSNAPLIPHSQASLFDLTNSAPTVSGAPTVSSIPTRDTALSDAQRGVAFVLRPPTVPKEDCVSLNEAVHLEWLKGRGAAWISGSPELRYSKEQGSFQIQVADFTSASPDPCGTIITESGLAAALDTLEDAALDECVSRHLTEGGDDRLHLDDAGVNKYYCPPRPLPNDVVIRGSCTCSAPTRDGYEAARRVLRGLWSGRVKFGDSMADMRVRLSKALRLSVPHEVVMHPSGSDAELIPLAVAAARAENLGCSGIVNIVAAAGEVGSGTAPAAGGRHFSEFTPCGTLVGNGDVVADFPTSTTVVEIKPRDRSGELIRTYDDLVMDAVTRESAAQEKPFFVVHAVDGSKTGLRLPTQNLLTRLMEELGDRLLIVMDACQCRSEPEEINWFLTRGAVILVTASKFFSAPGFCGAVLVPGDACKLLDEWPTPPVGLSDYLTRHEVPSTLRSLHRSLPAGPKNIGLLLRWACGIQEMEMFAAMGDAVKIAMREWVYGVRRLVCRRQPALDLIDVDCAECVGDETRAGGVNSVVSIKFLTRCGSRHLDATTLRRMHRHLTIDASGLLPSSATKEEREAVKLQCMVGQPVKLGDFGVLRLAVGAPLARDMTQPGRLEVALENDARILDKMIVLARYCEEMTN